MLRPVYQSRWSPPERRPQGPIGLSGYPPRVRVGFAALNALVAAVLLTLVALPLIPRVEGAEGGWAKSKRLPGAAQLSTMINQLRGSAAGATTATGGRRIVSVEYSVSPNYDDVGNQVYYIPRSSQSIGVTITYCSGEGLDESSRYITLSQPDSAPKDLTSVWDYQESNGNGGDCDTQGIAQGSIPVIPGQSVIDTFVCDPPTDWCGGGEKWFNFVDTTYVDTTTPTPSYPPASPPPPTLPVVSALTSSAGAPAGATGVVQQFLIRNRKSDQRTFTLTPACTASASSCTANNQITIAAGADSVAAVSHSVNSSTGTLGTVALSALDQSDGTHNGTDTVRVLVGPAPINDLPAVVSPALQVRELCITVAAGADGASQCGDLQLAHALPGTRVMNTVRAPALIYNSATAHPRPLISASVTMPSGATATAITALLTVNGTPQRTVTFSPWTGNEPRLLVVGFDGSPFTTGLYQYTLEVRRIHSGGYDVIHSVPGDVAVVNRSTSPFGAGWWVAGLEQLVTSGTKKLWIGGDGSTRVYTTTNASIGWRAADVEGIDSIVPHSAGLCRKLQGGGCVIFDAANGRHTATLGRLATTNTSTWVSQANFAYDGSARLKTIKIPLASGAPDSVTFSYNVNGQLTSVTGMPSPAPRVVTVYPGSSGRIDSIMDPVGTDSLRVRFAYAGSSHRIVGRTDRLGYTTGYAYDAGGKLSQVRTPVTASRTDTLRLQALESRGVLTDSTGAPITAAQAYTLIDGARRDVGDSTLIWLNGYGAPRRIRDAVGHETQLTYHTTWAGQVLKVIDPLGYEVEATFDARGRIASRVEKNPHGTSQNATTRYVWNSWDQVDSIIPQVGPISTFGYDAGSGNRTWQQVGPSSATRVLFNYYTSGTLAGLPRSVSVPEAGMDSIEYHPRRANVAAYLTPSSKRYRTQYHADTLGRDTLVVAPVDSLQQRHTRTWTRFDIMGRDTLTMTRGYRPPTPGALGDTLQTLVVQKSYDGEGRLASVKRSAIPDSIGGYIFNGYEYDRAGRKVADIDNYDLRDSVTYDGEGNVVAARNRRGFVTTMRYDPVGRLTERVVPGVSYDRYCHAEINLPTMGSCEVPFPYYPNSNRGLMIAPEVTRFWYDHRGRMTRAINNDAQIERGYHRNGQLQTDVLKVWSIARDTLTAYAMSHAYDLAGRDTAFTYSDGTSQTRYGYQDGAQGALDRVTDPDGNAFQFAYDNAGRLLQQSVIPAGWSGASFIETWSYDSLGNRKGRIDQRTAAAVGGYAVLDANSFSYDARGRIIKYSNAGPAANSPIANATFTYSGLGALIKTDYVYHSSAAPPADEWYTDALGFRLWQITPDGGRNADHPQPLSKRLVYSGDRLETVEAAEPGSMVTAATYPDFTSYLYDPSGNVTRIAEEARGWRRSDPSYEALLVRNESRLYHGADNRLRFMQRAAAADPTSQANVKRRGTFEEYRYDPLGRRVMVWARRPNPALCNRPECVSYVDRYIWNGDQLVEETYRGNGVRYVHGMGIDRPLKIGAIIPHADYRGMYRAGSYVTGASYVGIDYPAANRGQFADEGSVRIPNGYASLLQDQTDGTGLMYRRNRYYDPKSGRFTQEDPIGLAGGLNLYGYANGDPVNFSDPFGLDCRVAYNLQPCPVDFLQTAKVFRLFGEAVVNVTLETLQGFAETPGAFITPVRGAGAGPRPRGADPAISKLPLPRTPGGMSMAQFGRIMQWGKNSSADARAQIGKFSKSYYESHGVTAEIAQEWAEYYANEALRVKGNPSAAGRADLMRHVARLLSR